MNKYLKRILLIVAALIYYFGTTIGFAWALVNMNLAAGWMTFFAMVAHLIIVGPTVMVIILSLFGELDDFGNTDAEEEEDLLIHAVINQLETDFNDNDFDSMAELIEQLIENGEEDTLHHYLSDTAQQNMKEGLTVKRW